MEQPDAIGLSEALEALRAELAAAHAESLRSDVQFPIKTLTVELKVGATRTASGKAGFKVPLIGTELGGSAGYDRESVQTITLVLGAPVDREGNPFRVSDRTSARKDG